MRGGVLLGVERAQVSRSKAGTDPFPVARLSELYSLLAGV